MGFTSILAMIIGISGPYVVHLGTVDVRYPYGIMAIISLCAAIAVSFEIKIVHAFSALFGYSVSASVFDPYKRQ